MVRESDAIRVESWINEAVGDGAELVVGGNRDRANLQPALLDNASPGMRVCGRSFSVPAVAVVKVRDVNEAIAMANDSEFGLSAGIFTRDIDSAMRFAHEVRSGNIHINWGPLWRTDAMPMGG